MSWRITFIENKAAGTSFVQNVTENRLIKPETQIVAPCRIEIRDDDGQIFRLGTGAEFELKDSPYGVRPHVKGPILVGKKRLNCAKGTMSCWLVPLPQFETVDIFIAPVTCSNVEDYYLLSGGVSIIEFDEDAKPFHICSTEEGHKASIRHEDGKPMRQRYTVVSNEAYSDEEYGTIFMEYLDRRRWK